MEQIKVMKPYIGPLFCRPDAYEVVIDVCKIGSSWHARGQVDGFASHIWPGHRSKKAAVAAANEWAASITAQNERARASRPQEEVSRG